MLIIVHRRASTVLSFLVRDLPLIDILQRMLDVHIQAILVLLNCTAALFLDGFWLRQIVLTASIALLNLILFLIRTEVTLQF